MDGLVIAGITVMMLACGLIIGYQIASNRKSTHKKPACTLYLLRINDSGKVEIKQAQRADMWDWRV